jgi:phage terminase large subunit-like protein
MRVVMQPVLEEDFRHLDCWGGLDLGATGDFTALALCWPMPDGRIVLRAWAYVPLATLGERIKRDGKPYAYWVERGWMKTTAGQTTDQDEVFAHIEELNVKYRIQGIACDRWRIKYIEKKMEAAGITAFDWGQGYQGMAPAIRLFEDLAFNKRISHDDNGALRWNMDCCEVMSDPAGNKKLVKPKTHINSRHIDMSVAAVMAVGAAETCIGEVDPYSNGARLVSL